jgi:hypothetical protein
VTDPLLGELLSDTRELVARLLDEPLVGTAELSRQLDEHEAAIRASVGTRSLSDWRAGVDLVERARRLLAAWSAESPRGRRLIQVAVRYLAMDDDGSSDLESPFGFDDDQEVMEAVERALGSAR